MSEPVYFRHMFAGKEAGNRGVGYTRSWLRRSGMIQTWLHAWQPQCSCRSRYHRNGVTKTRSSPPQRGQVLDARRSWRELRIAIGRRGASGNERSPVDVPDFGTPEARR